MVEAYINVKENSLSMMLMIPQYIAMTIGEILFSISGLAFAYTQVHTALFTGSISSPFLLSALSV